MSSLVNFLLVLPTLAALNSYCRGETFTFSCLEELDERNGNSYLNEGCIVANLSEKHLQDVDRLKFPIAEHIVLYHPEVTELTKNLIGRMGPVKKLSVYGGNVPRIQIGTQLESLFLYGCKTDQLIINEQDDYSLTRLESRENPFTVVPLNINRLKRLTHLRLYDGIIDELDMNRFDGMENLVLIGLSSDRIRRIVTDKTVSLPSLELFMAANNSLTELDVRNWQMPNLVALDLWSNKLKYIVDLNRFDKLIELQLYDNELNCDWVPDAERALTGSLYSRALLQRRPCPVEKANRYMCCIGDRSDPAFLEYLRVKGAA